VPCRPR